MEMALQESSAQGENLGELQSASLKMVALLVGAIGYLWLWFLLWPYPGNHPPAEAWLGGILSVVSASVAHALRRRALRLASHLLVWGSWVGVACALLTFRLPGLAYLFILPVTFASVLLGQEAIGAVAAAAGLVCAAIGLGQFGLPLFSVEVGLPILVIALIAAASWFSARNLYIALNWVWNGYERAHHNERLAREQQADLRRALKALDEATYRLERANYMLTLARDQAEEARRLKQQFAQTISHELRTPLNLIVGFTELMSQTPEYYGAPLPPPYQRDLGIVHRNARHLQTLVNDVLDLARIEAAQMSLLPEDMDPAALVQDAVNTARSLAEVHGLTLHIEIERGLPRLWIDPTRIRQVLFNLLSNAVRFTERGGITVSVRRATNEVVFSVADTGMGIAAEDLPRLFEDFTQLDGSTRRRHEGAGLGLAISRQFVELHGGHIWVESTVGQGSTFHFSLPEARQDALVDGGRTREAPRSVPAAQSEERVLLAITQSRSAATLLSRYVRGCRTVIVGDLEQARRAAAELLPQAVVIDTASGAPGPAELRGMAQSWGLPRTLFVACPLPGEEPLRQRLAVDGYLIKPVSLQSLWDVLRRFSADVDDILIIDDDPDFVRLLCRLLDSPLRRYQVNAAYSATEGLEMLQHQPPDLVLLDMMLPDMDGAQLLERIRANPAWRRLPIVIVSGQDEIDAIGALPGEVVISKGAGLLPGEVVQHIQQALDAATWIGAAAAHSGAPHA